jgi:hypothetical protein
MYLKLQRFLIYRSIIALIYSTRLRNSVFHIEGGTQTASENRIKIKIKLSLCLLTKDIAMKTYSYEGGGSTEPPFSTSALDEGELSASRPVPLYIRGKPIGSPWKGGWIGP